MKKTILSLLLLVVSSCYRELKIDIPEQEVSPVVNSIFQTDSIISLSIGKTEPILQNGPRKITEAVVTLYENGNEKEPLEFDGESFKSSGMAEAGKQYKIVVEIPKFKTISAEDKLTDFPKIVSASYKDSVYVGDEGDLFSQATIEIENPPGQDYYELDMFLKVIDAEQSNEDEEFTYRSTGSILYFDPILNDIVIQNEGLLPYIPSKLIFSDELMSVGTYTLRINYRSFNSTLFSNNSDKDIALIMKLRKVSKNYYEFKKTLIQHIETQFGDIWDGVGQPLPVFSNIQNGYGIFAGFSQVTDTIQKQ